MFCAKCEKILDLDVLFGTSPHTYENMARSKPYPHYDDFASFASSAAAGCELCKLVYRPLLEHVASQITSLQGSDANLSFELCYDDILRFTIRDCPPDIGGFFCEIQLNSHEGTVDPASSLGGNADGIKAIPPLKYCNTSSRLVC